MAKQPEKTEAERWREIADQYGKQATRLGTAVIELEAEVQQLLAELAAAKAASVCPVEIESVYINKYIHAVVVFIGNEKGTLGFEAWLTKRQDKTPPGS